MKPQHISLGPEELRRLKVEAVGERPYTERISTSFAILLIAMRESRGDYYPVLDELEYLEGRRKSSKTKQASQFDRDPRLRWLWHKHYSSARHIPRNIKICWGVKDIDLVLADVALRHGDDPGAWPRALARELVVGGYESRVGSLTGEWILYAVHEGLNYYLAIGTHEEGKDPEGLLTRLHLQCEAEWPFLFE